MITSKHPSCLNLPTTFRGLILPRLLAIAAAIPFLPSPVNAATVVQYGPSNSYVEETISFGRTGTPSGSAPYTVQVPFDTTTPLSPSEGYTGPTFYGGYTFSSDTYSIGFSRQGILNDYAKANGNDLIYLNVVGSSGDTNFYATTMHFASVFVFRQNSFNPPFSTGNVSIDGFSIGVFKHANGSTAPQFKPEGRWLVEIGGTYYLSNQTFTNTVNESYTTFQLSGEALQSTLWAAYDPASNIFFDASNATFEALNLTGVTSVGFYIEDRDFQTTKGTVGMRLGIGEFSVTTSIPEPGSLALLGLGIPILFRCFLHHPIK